VAENGEAVLSIPYSGFVTSSTIVTRYLQSFVIHPNNGWCLSNLGAILKRASQTTSLFLFFVKTKSGRNPWPNYPGTNQTINGLVSAEVCRDDPTSFITWLNEWRVCSVPWMRPLWMTWCPTIFTVAVSLTPWHRRIVGWRPLSPMTSSSSATFPHLTYPILGCQGGGMNRWMRFHKMPYITSHKS
jgi:hypothetical protein